MGGCFSCCSGSLKDAVDPYTYKRNTVSVLSDQKKSVTLKGEDSASLPYTVTDSGSGSSIQKKTQTVFSDSTEDPSAYNRNASSCLRDRKRSVTFDSKALDPSSNTVPSAVPYSEQEKVETVFSNNIEQKQTGSSGGSTPTNWDARTCLPGAVP